MKFDLWLQGLLLATATWYVSAGKRDREAGQRMLQRTGLDTTVGHPPAARLWASVRFGPPNSESHTPVMFPLSTSRLRRRVLETEHLIRPLPPEFIC